MSKKSCIKEEEEKQERQGKESRKWLFKKVFFFLTLFSLLFLSFFSLFLLFSDRLLPPLQIEKPEWSTEVLDYRGEADKVLRKFTTTEGYWRFPADLDSIDPTFITFLLAYEDKRFWQHSGVDIRAVCRAVCQLIRHRRIVSGASTLTMQTVRLLHPRPRTIVSKIVEMIEALRLEKCLSKREILQLYLSLAPYGGNLQGIEAASFFYFGKNPARLTPSQSALLVALPQSPETRRPDRFQRKAKTARDAVLARFYEQKLLTKEAFHLALLQPVPKRRRSVPFYAPQLTEKLHQEFSAKNRAHCKKETGADIFAKNRIIATLDISLQQKLEGISANLQKQFSAERGTKSAAIMVVENKSRAVRAHIGSASFAASQMDLTTALRSPGSTLKPFIYGLAFEKGSLHPETRILDRPQQFGGYRPQNFDKIFHGWVSIRKALRLSLNLPAVQVLDRVRPQRLLARFERVGVPLQFQEDAGLAIALGGVGIRLCDLTALYSALASGGQYLPLHYLREDKGAENSGELLSPAANWYVNDILCTEDSFIGGGNDGRNSGGQRCAPNQIRYKTGTSYGFRDAWAVGYNAEYTVGVWVGQVDGRYDKDSTGIDTAVPILMQVFANLPIEPAARESREEMPPAEVLAVSQNELPPHLRWFGGLTQPVAELLISYPPDGSLLVFEENMKIPLQGSGGTPPLYWLVNGEVFGESREGETLFYPADKAGVLGISLIDSKGKSVGVRVMVE